MATLLTNNNQPTTEIRFGWILVLIFCSGLMVFREFDALSNLVFLSLTISMIALKTVNYQISSFSSLFVLTSIIFYPFAVSLNLLLPIPAVRPDLWVHTYSSLIGYVYSITFLIFGFGFVNLIFRNRSYKTIGNNTSPLLFNILLFSIIFLVVPIKIATGNYYHTTIGGFVEVSNWSNILGLSSWVSYCGLYLQMNRYFKTRAKIDGMFTLAMLFIPILLSLPSGNRESAIEHLPIAFILYLTFEKNLKLRIFALSTSLVMVTFLLIFMYAYRDSGITASNSVADQYSQVADAEYISANQTPVQGLIERVSEFAALGRVIDHVPKRTPHSGLHSMDTWWQILIPGTFRPTENKLNFNEPAEFSRDIGIAPGWWSSAPIMLKGDFFRRFGWTGLCFGMFLVGLSIRILDYCFRSKSDIFRIIFYTIMAKTIWRLYSGSFLSLVVGFTRELLLAVLIAYVLTYVASLKGPKKLSR